MAETFDFAIIGAGIVGLAVAREVLSRCPDCTLLILEKEKAIACHQTGHNSGVIHSGIYYQPGSLKARLCVAGSAAMIDFVKLHGLPYEQCGKVIAATEPAEIPALEELCRRGSANGVPGLRWLPDASAIREIEPHAGGIRGIHVPSTAITDFRKVAEQYARLVAGMGAALHFNAQVNRITRRQNETIVNSKAGEFRARYLINCAGLQSDRVARMSGATLDMAILPFRGEYYELRPEKHHLVRGLIYPVPDPSFPFLGVHFTRRVTGGVEAGPNAVLALKREGYTRSAFSWKDCASILSSSRFWKMGSRYWRAGVGELHRSWSKAAFTRSLQKLLPELQREDLRPGGAGVRAQAIDNEGKLVDDFRFVHTEGATHVCNVPSPAATASLQIAVVVVDAVLKCFNPGKRDSNAARCAR
ncbi:MAG TPA: L-2-hydroxyglutarate oxidase [Terriglobia bacterium]|nr:L-2-hydroxyglutarate oxidase [Terriglobia bacterium]